MKVLPLDVGVIHFIGIGGIGMSGIAEVLHHLGYRVQGTDQQAGANVLRLRDKGIMVHVGHRAENLGDARVVVFSSAVDARNPEMIEARARRLPVVRRAEMLGELMRLKSSIAIAGTHGKTTTTSLVAALLDAAGYDPTVVNGGIINAYGTNARVGAGTWMVVESDESDGSFLRLPATIGVVTNIDPEHMEHYGTFDAVRDAYFSFVERLPFYGFAVLCLDHPEVQALIAKVTDRRVVTYGFSPQADVRATELTIEPDGSTFNVAIAPKAGGEATRLKRMHLAMPGRHNVQNALAAIAIAEQLGIDHAATRRAFATFEGVKRRFTITGKVGGVTIVDDYGHHPVEIRAVLSTARQATAGRVVAILQPHRYSRLADLFDQFCSCLHDADTVLIAPVYAAGEPPIDGVDRDHLVAGVRARGHRDVRPIEGDAGLARMVRSITRPGDLVVCLGAGSVSAWANALPGELSAMARAA